jgi:hypothetical protein
MKNKKAEDGVYHPGLMCGVLRVDYDFLKREGRLFVPTLDCTDQRGAISFFMVVDPDVRRILVLWEDNEIDTVYEKRRNGTWIGYGPNEPDYEQDDL